MWSDALEGLDHASRASELAPIGADYCLADCHSHVDSARYRAFFRAPPYGDMINNLPKQQAAARARRAKPGAEGAGKAKRSERRAREDCGWGWAGGVNKPYHPPHPTPPPPQHPRQREPEGRSPARTRRQGGAQRPPRQGGLRVGVGGAVQTSRTTHPTQHPRPPNIRDSASPKGEARRERAGKAERSDRRAREDYGWGWAGGVTKPNHPPRRHHPSAQAEPFDGTPCRASFRAPVSPTRAKMLVVDVVGDGRMVAANRTLLVATELEGAELHLE